MPSRLIELAMTSATAGTVVAAAVSTIEKPQTQVEVWGDINLLSYSVIGSMVGGLIGVLVFPPKEETQSGVVRRISMKMITSILTGVLFTPMVLRKAADYSQHWAADGYISTDVLIGVSGLISIFGVSALHYISAIIQQKTNETQKKRGR